MSARTVAKHGLGLGHACDCGSTDWRLETFIDAVPAQPLGGKWTQFQDSGARRWTCMACGAEYLTRIRVSAAQGERP